MTAIELAQRLGELRAELRRVSELLAEPGPSPSEEEEQLRGELAELDEEIASLRSQAQQAYAQRDELESQVIPLRESLSAGR